MLSEAIKKEALNLSAKDKAELIEVLMNNLDKPDPETEKIWKEESENRIKAHKAGKIKSVPYSQIKKKYES